MCIRPSRSPRIFRSALTSERTFNDAGAPIRKEQRDNAFAPQLERLRFKSEFIHSSSVYHDLNPAHPG